MIQETGKAYDNHFEPKGAKAESYVLHYRDRSALVRVSVAQTSSPRAR